MSRPYASGDAPLTFGQLSLWRSEMATPVQHRPEWHFIRVWRVPPGRSLDDVRDALAALTRRHEALRTVLACGDDGDRQVLRPDGPIPVVSTRPGIDLDGAHEVARELAREPFDLTADLPWRPEVLLDAHGQPAFVAVAFHHMAADNWGLAIADAEFSGLIGDRRDALLASWQPADLATFQRSPKWSARAEAARRFWRRTLVKYPRADEATEMSFAQAVHRVQAAVTSPSLRGAFETVAARYEVTLPAAVLTVCLAEWAHLKIELSEPLVLMASNRFDPRWRSIVSTMNQAAMIDLPTLGGADGEVAREVELASRVAFRHGCYDIDDFTNVVTEVRGAPLTYDYFFNFAVPDRLSVAAPATAAAPEFFGGRAPQQTGPKLDIRITGRQQLKVDIRAAEELVPAGDLQALTAAIYERAHQVSAG